MRVLLDVNVLIALHDPQHVHHELAVEALGRSMNGWASCPLTQNGCLRIMCQPSYSANAFSLREVAGALSVSFSSALHEFWPDEIGLLDPGRLRMDRVHGHRQLTDLYLLSLAVHRGGCFLSFDARIPLEAVRGAEPRHLRRLLAP